MTTGSAASERVIPFTGLRGAVARAMQAAWSAPRVTVAMDANLDACLALREERQAQGGPRLSPTAFIVRAAALALREHPLLNGWVGEDGLHVQDDVNVGVAVSVDGGLVVPVLRTVDTMTVEAIAEEIRAQAVAAREGQLTPRAIQGGTFTVSSLGPTGATWFTPIINAPQVAILGVGAAERRPVVDADGGLAVATMATLTLAFDHRATDGQPAALFLRSLRDLLQEPERL